MKLLRLKPIHGIHQMLRRYSDVATPRTGHIRPRLQPHRWRRQPPASQSGRRILGEDLGAPVYLREHPEF
ncbi:MAG: hypothetical protein HUU04_01150 [Verrucomicrobiae bacterium]|nr:hypothetical protein [Verrucomicrobiae bacterium]